MALPGTGPISIGNIRTELGNTGTNSFSLAKAGQQYTAVIGDGYVPLNNASSSKPNSSSPFSISEWYSYDHSTNRSCGVTFFSAATQIDKYYYQRFLITGCGASCKAPIRIFYSNPPPNNLSPRTDYLELHSSYPFNSVGSLTGTAGYSLALGFGSSGGPYDIEWTVSSASEPIYVVSWADDPFDVYNSGPYDLRVGCATPTNTPTPPVTPTPTSSPAVTPSSTPAVTPTKTVTPSATNSLPYSYTIYYLGQCFDGEVFYGYAGDSTASGACLNNATALTVYSSTSPFQNGMALYLNQQGTSQLCNCNCTDWYYVYDSQSFVLGCGDPDCNVSGLAACTTYYTVELYARHGNSASPNAIDIYYSTDDISYNLVATLGVTTTCTQLFPSYSQVAAGTTVYFKVQDANLANYIYFNGANGAGNSCPANSQTYCTYSFQVNSNTAMNITAYNVTMFGDFVTCP